MPKGEHPSDVYSFSDAESDSDNLNGLLNPEAEKLLDRSEDLLSEVEAFQRTLRRNKLENTVELRQFVTQVKSEHRRIQGLALEPSDSAKAKIGISSSNLPYHEAVWRAAKSTTGITAFYKTFSIVEERGKMENGKRAKRTKSSVTVDVVAQNGLQWIKVSTITSRRLLFEIAKAGWEEGDSESYAGDSSDEENPYPDSSSTATTLATSKLNLTTLASSLHRAASQIRIQYLHPTVHIVLPKIDPTSPDAAPEIAEFLKALVATGVHVQCGNSDTSSRDLSPPRSLTDMLEDISTPTPRHAKPISDPLNLDTTILLALISDISNLPSVPVEPRFHPMILRQLEMEKEQPMLPMHLFPVLSGRQLICTPSARDRFDEIVSIIASETERARAELVFDILPGPKKQGDVTEELTPEERVRRLQELCVHPLPQDLRLPIQTLAWQYHMGSHIDADIEKTLHFKKVAQKLSQVNRGVFMTGWQKEWTIISSNRAVAKMIETVLEEIDAAARKDGQELVVGPDIYVIPTARSLVGKAKKIEV